MITMQMCGVIIDSLYRNYELPKFEQKSLRDLAKHCGVATMTFDKVRRILIDMKLLIVEGRNKGQQTIWHPDKCSPNPAMVTEVYKKYAKDAKCRIKVSVVKKVASPSLESSLQALVKLGYTGVISKVNRDGYKTVTECIDLSKIELGD